VLPLWRDQLRIGISPHAITLVRIGKGLRPYVREQHVEPCPAASGESWQAVLDKLTQLLSQTKWQHANVTVTLSNHFVRYLLIPWNADINGDQEQTAYVKHRFNKVFGTVANNWALRHHQSAIGKPGLASGINTALLDGIRKVCQTNNLNLRSVQPYLMPAFNQYRHLFKNDPIWFMVVEHETLIIALLHQQSWQFISTHRISNEDLVATLPSLIERQIQLNSTGTQAAKVLLLAPEHAKLSFPKHTGWTIEQLQPQTSLDLSAQKYALAMGEN
jgi:hypothetical protein